LQLTDIYKTVRVWSTSIYPLYRPQNVYLQPLAAMLQPPSVGHTIGRETLSLPRHRPEVHSKAVECVKVRLNKWY